MGKAIAELYAKLGLDSSQFQKGLADSKTKLSGFLSTMNNTPLGTFAKELTGVSLSSLSVVGAVAGIAKEIGKAITMTSEYTSSIEDMSRLLGISAEDTSRLVQASDDLFITEDKLKGALQAASRQGIDVSIKGLKDLSKQYLDLNPGVERAQFLMQTFGRSGSDMGKLLEVGSVGIDAATASISSSLIVTDKAIEINRRYKQTLDGIADSTAGAGMAVGGKFLEALNVTATGVQGFINVIQTGKFWPEATNKAMRAWTDGLNAQAEAYYKLHPELQKSADDMKALFDPMRNAADAMQKFNTNLLYSIASQGMEADEALSLANKMGLVDQATVTAAEKTAEYKKQLDEGKISLSEYTNLVAGLDNYLRNLPANVPVHIQFTADDMPVYPKPKGATQTAHAAGGSFMIPPSYGSEGFRLGNGDTASGGEKLTITPKGKEIGGMTAEDYKKALADQARQIGSEIALRLMQYGLTR